MQAEAELCATNDCKGRNGRLEERSKVPQMIKVRTEGCIATLGHDEAVSIVREAELAAEIIGGLLDANRIRKG